MPSTAHRVLTLGLLSAACAHASSAELAPVPAPPSCVDPSPPQPVELELVELLTYHRGVRWFRATWLGRQTLAWLKADGSIGLLELPIQSTPESDTGLVWDVCTPDGDDQIRCFESPSGRVDGTWRPLWSIAVTLPPSEGDAPVLGALERWPDAPPSHLVAAASHGARALLVFEDIRWQKSEDDRYGSGTPVYRASRLELWDVPARRRIESDAGLIEGTVTPLATWCSARTCTFLARHQQGLSFSDHERGPANLVAMRAPHGSLQDLRMQVLAEEIEGDGLYESPQVLRVGEARVVVVRQRQRLQLLALDADGELRGQSRLAIDPLGDYVALDDGLLGYRRSAAREGHDWELLEISAQAQILARHPVESEAIGIKAARLGAGFVVAGLTGDVSYDDVGDYAFHSWQFWADQRFISADASTDWITLLGEGSPSVGDGRGGYEVEWLVRPGRAAALVWPTGDAWATPQLVPVRRPCANTSP